MCFCGGGKGATSSMVGVDLRVGDMGLRLMEVNFVEFYVSFCDRVM